MKFWLNVRATLYAVPNEPSVQVPAPNGSLGKPLPELRGVEPLQLNSPRGLALLSAAKFCPGDTIALNWKPYTSGDSYQIA